MTDELEALRAENSRLIALLESNGIEWRASGTRAPSVGVHGPSRLTIAEKVARFRRLFRGRTDVYPIRWESRTTGKAGYAPACANEWRTGVCGKPRIKCRDCGNRLLIPLSDPVIYDHLAGVHTIGVYPLLEDDSCHFLAVDFDEADWRDDVDAFMQSCEELGVPVALEISRSGEGAHAWVFFAGRVSARDARRLGTAIISHTCTRIRQLKLTSCDRLFPNQDTMPRGGFGNLIALPLQKGPRERGFSVFVDAGLRPYPDQWAYLASIQPMADHDIEPTILRATGGVHPLDVTFIDDEDLATPWKRRNTATRKLPDPMPESLTVTLANLIYLEKTQLPQALANRLIRLAAFQNPEFYRAQAMRMSVWDKPRVIGCAENFPQHIALHGRMSKKQRAALIAALDAMPPDAPRVLLATGKLVGEGFDHPPLDTLVLAMPVSWQGTLQQYAGRLHREHAGKTDVRIIDFVDTGHPALLRMWDKRQRGYRTMGYRIEVQPEIDVLNERRRQPFPCVDPEVECQSSAR